MSKKTEVNATKKYNLNDVVNDKEQPPSEIANDVFDRQRVMKNFQQKTIEEQRAFVLGVGGIGSSIAMSLVRMGVDTIHLLDRDYIEASNLNRQILFSLSDVGKSKVEIAAKNLKEIHNLRTNIYEYHLDAVSNWSTVVQIARKSTVIFNNIDYGSVFDYAVNSLCKSLNIIYVSGSTYANNIEIHFFSGQFNDSCWACHNHTQNSFQFIDKQLENINDIQLFLKESYMIQGEQSETLVKECLNELKIDTFSSSQSKTLFLPLYERKMLKMLLPSSIQSYPSISFIPKDRSFPTRQVGSWIGVCVSGSCLIVNTWIQYLMKVKNENFSFHNWTQLNLSMYDGGYNTVGFSNERNLQCEVCSNAKQHSDKK